MGSNTLLSVSDGTEADETDVNQYRSALIGNLVPRNGSGVATDLAGSLGESTFRLLKAYIASGYWDIGDIKTHHNYGGAAPIGEGWFPCLGGVINEANYDAIFGTGHWATYVVSSALDGKYSPDMVGKYLVGAATTPQDGSVALTSVGTSTYTLDLEHSHIWYATFGTGVSSLRRHIAGTDSTSNQRSLTYDHAGGPIYDILPTPPVHQYYYTDKQLNDGVDIQPTSIEVTYYIRII